MKILFVGDTHGNWEVVQHALDSPYPDRVVFIGDYLDSFNRSIDEQVKTLLLVLNACEDNPEKYIGLMGNHELSYLEEGMRASGFNTATHGHVVHLEDRIKRILKPYVWIDDWLASHAGVSNQLLKDLNCTLEEYLHANQHNQIGVARGGWSSIGGLYWCDFNREFDCIPGVNQIVGHSNYLPIDKELKYKTGKDSINVCVDTVPQHRRMPDIKDTIFFSLVDGKPEELSWADLC